MGVDMHSYGSALRLKEGTDESLLVEVGRTTLLDPNGYAGSDPYRMADLGEIEAATTLEDLFAAFRQILVRDENHRLVACFGYDDRHYDPASLLEAMSPDLVSGSWYGYKTDNDERVLHVRDGHLETTWIEEYVLNADRVAEWASRGHFSLFAVAPFSEGESDAVKLTILARLAAKRDDLLEAIPAPDLDYREKITLLHERAPYQLTS